MYDLTSDTDREDALIQLLDGVLGDHKTHRSHKKELSYDCPVCSAEKGVTADGKANLEVNYGKGVFQCWACGDINETRGNILKLIKMVGSKSQVSNFVKLGIRFSFENDEGETITFTPTEKLKLPPEYIALKNLPNQGEFKRFFQYLQERNITADLIEKFNIGCATTGKYFNRLILPSYDANGDLNYFVTRTVNPRVKKFKYLNCDVLKKTIVFNEKYIDWNKAVFLVEGPFDHLVVPNSIPLLGKVMSDLLFTTLYNKAQSNIVLVLDPDAWANAEKTYNKLDGGRLMGKIHTIKMPENIDVSLYNQYYGKDELFKKLRETIQLKD